MRTVAADSEALPYTRLNDLLTNAVKQVDYASPADKVALRQAAVPLTDKPEKDYTADDWRTRAFAAYTDNKMDEAIVYFSKESETFGVSTGRVAKALLNKGFALAKLDRSEEAIAVYDDLLARFDTAPQSALREKVASALLYKGHTLGKLGRREEAAAVNDDYRNRLATVVRNIIAKSHKP